MGFLIINISLSLLVKDMPTKNRRWGNPAGTQHSLVLFMKTRIGVMSCGTAGPLGSVPGMSNHLQGDQVN